MTRGGRLFREICGLRAELPGGRYLKGTWKLSGQRTELPKSAMPEISAPETPSPKASAPEMVPPEGSLAERFSPKAPAPETPPAEKEIPAPERTCCPKGRCLQAAGTQVSAPMDERTSPQDCGQSGTAACRRPTNGSAACEGSCMGTKHAQGGPGRGRQGRDTPDLL